MWNCEFDRKKMYNDENKAKLMDPTKISTVHRLKMRTNYFELESR